MSLLRLLSKSIIRPTYRYLKWWVFMSIVSLAISCWTCSMGNGNVHGPRQTFACWRKSSQDKKNDVPYRTNLSRRRLEGPNAKETWFRDLADLPQDVEGSRTDQTEIMQSHATATATNIQLQSAIEARWTDCGRRRLTGTILRTRLLRHSNTMGQ